MIDYEEGNQFIVALDFHFYAHIGYSGMCKEAQTSYVRDEVEVG